MCTQYMYIRDVSPLYPINYHTNLLVCDAFVSCVYKVRYFVEVVAVHFGIWMSVEHVKPFKSHLSDNI